MRGIKAALLLPNKSDSASVLRMGENIRLVSQGTVEYFAVLAHCRTPLPQGSEIVYRLHFDPQSSMTARADDVHRYVELLVQAGSDAAKLEAKQSKRKLPLQTRRELGMPLATL